MADEVIIDGTQLTWQDFADRLMALAASPQQQSTYGYVRAPLSCRFEANRLLGNLDLADRIALLAEEPVRRPSAVPLRRRLRDHLTTALASVKSPVLRPRQPSHD